MINDNEYSYRFNIPSGRNSDYVFAMTFANDHKVTLLSEEIEDLCPTPKFASLVRAILTETLQSDSKSDREENTVSSQLFNRLVTDDMSTEQYRMMMQSKRYIRRICALPPPIYDVKAAVNEFDFPGSKINETDLHNHAKKFALLYPNPDEANEVLAALSPVINRFLDKSKSFYSPCNTSVADNTTELSKLDCAANIKVYDVLQLREVLSTLQSFPTLTWDELIYASCYQRVEFERAKKANSSEEAIQFFLQHGESAPFLAAAAFVSRGLTHESTASSISAISEEKRIAYNFMAHFSDEMNLWYDYQIFSCKGKYMIILRSSTYFY